MTGEICGVITLYFPQEDVFLNIDTYIRYLDRLFIVDNTPDPDTRIHARLRERYPQAELCSFGKNLGVAKALNIGLTKGSAGGYRWLLTMDQDSFFEPAQAERFFASAEAEPGGAGTAVLSPSHQPRACVEGACLYEEQSVVMTSGNLLRIEVVSAIGMFDEKLFIDSVDHDYCLRVRKAGYSVLQATNCYLTHKVGELYSGSMFWGLRKREFRIHSPKRMYFIIRNGLYLEKMYTAVSPEYIRTHRKHVIDKITKALKYSDQRAEYLRYIVKALFHYATNRYGNAVDI